MIGFLACLWPEAYLYYACSVEGIWKDLGWEVSIFSFFWKNSMLPPSQFLYLRSMGTNGALLTLSLSLQVALDEDMEERLVEFEFSAAFDRAGLYGLLYKERSIGVWQFLSITEFLSDRCILGVWMGRSVSVDVVPGVPHGIVLTVYIVHLQALPHCWEPYCGLCEGHHDICSYC